MFRNIIESVKFWRNATHTVGPPGIGVNGKKSQNILATLLAFWRPVSATDGHQQRFDAAILVRAQRLHLFDVVRHEVTVPGSQVSAELEHTILAHIRQLRQSFRPEIFLVRIVRVD